MYRFIKNIYLKLIPSKIKHKWNPFVRNVLYKLFYSGNKYFCPSCKSNLKKFITYEYENFNDLICPKCGSLSRTRCLTLYLDKHIAQPNIKVLDFSPHRSLYNYWHNKQVNYTANDYENEFLSDTQQDITSLTFNSEEFDLIICYHVLEHIQDDDKAINELFRVLKSNSILLAQVPFKIGKTDEDPSVTNPEMRKIRFGQKDHVRYYGKDDFIKKLELHGFQVDPINYVKNFNADQIQYYGLKKDDTLFICKK